MDMLIDGKWVNSDKTFEIINPYTGKVVDTVPIATKEQIDEALEKSYNAEPKLSAKEKADILNKTANDLVEQKEELAKLISMESGLSLKHTLNEVQRTSEEFRLFADIALKIENKDITSEYTTPKDRAKLIVIADPMKLVVAITPFNHPLGQVAHKVCPAITAGACMVLKPPEKTPLTALKLAGLLIKNGLPNNMVNMITGNPPKYIVNQMITNPLVDMVTFTGSVEVGKYIRRKMDEGGNELKKYVAELGGNSALTILEDADLDRAAKIAIGAFDDSGQRCTSIKRILLHNKIADEFIKKLMPIAKSFTYGDPLDPNVDMGSIINEETAKLIERRVNLAIKDGAKLLLGNKRKGSLYSPTVLDNVNPKSELVVKETFGPIAPIIRINSVEGAIKIINSAPYKLAGAVVTKDRKKAELIAKKTMVGVFNWNNQPGFRSIMAPFGGYGISGNYEKEGVLESIKGMHSIRTFYEH